MRADDPRVLDLTVRELIERATREIVKASAHFPRYEKRIDLVWDVDMKDKKLGGRVHRIRTRLRITARSMLWRGSIGD